MILPNKELKKFITEHELSDIRQLALKSDLYPHIDIKFAVQQIAGRLTAKHKIPYWYNHEDIIYPVHLSMEQSSSEKTALYKAQLFNGNTFTDLTGGFGVDFSFISRSFTHSVYVEQQSELINLAKHNFKVLNIQNYRILEKDAVNYLNSIKSVQDLIYLDPARRNTSGKKTVLPEDCIPNIIEIDSLLDNYSKCTMIKLSPMLDIKYTLGCLNNITQVHIVSVANECKELIFIKEKQKADIEIFCINILNNGTIESFSFKEHMEHIAPVTYSNNTLRYLYEPNSSVMKSGAYKIITVQFGVKKLHPNSHLYTSDVYIDDFPGRKFIIKDIFSLNKKDIKLLQTKIQQANITCRNFPLDVSDIRKQTKLKDGGNSYIFATTLADGKKVLILCDKADSSNI